MKEYTTEDTFALLFDQCGIDYIRNKTIPESPRKFRPDFRLEKYKLIIEFDGHPHYTDPKAILRDVEKKIMCRDMGYKVIAWPYWMQLNEDGVEFLEQWIFEEIGEKLDLSNFHTLSYPHGFIDSNVYSPAFYCYQGMERFKNELTNGIFSNYRYEVIRSIYNHPNMKDKPSIMLPPKEVLPDFLKIDL